MNKDFLMRTQSKGKLNIIGRAFLFALPYNLAFCTIIAILFTLFGLAPEGGTNSFVHNFVFSQCIGSFCCLFSVAVHLYFQNQKIVIFGYGVALALGTIIGILTSCLIFWINPLTFLSEFSFFLKILFGTILFGSVIIYFWATQERLLETRTLASEERIRRLTSEKETAETYLKLLQAQVEPHFLFNTLSNILSLLDTDIEKGKSMLADLTHYLRISLSRTRREISTVGQEMEMITDYLRIFKVRMGERLQYRIDIPVDLKEANLPPMLVQPLVENAIKHGLEPKIGGGEISIWAEKSTAGLCLIVADTGLGLQTDRDTGTGLSNISERLQSLYGANGRLRLEENRPSGVKAIIEVPYETVASDHRR